MAWTLDLLRRLNEHGVNYVVIGGVAAVTHGSTRVTEDLDVCAPLDHDNAVRIVRALAHARPRWRMRPDLPPVTEDSPLLIGLKNLYLRTDLGQLDVLGELPGIGSFADLAGHVIEMEFAGIRCRVLDLDTLIASKQFAGREKDKPAVRELTAIRDMLRKKP